MAELPIQGAVSYGIACFLVFILETTNLVKRPAQWPLTFFTLLVDCGLRNHASSWILVPLVVTGF